MIQRMPGLLFIAACVAALALRALLPVGWMPATGGQGGGLGGGQGGGQGAILALCSVTAADDGQPLPGDGQRPCDFALALGPALATAALLLALLVLPVLPAPMPRPVHQRVFRHAARPPGQGPPRA